MSNAPHEPSRRHERTAMVRDQLAQRGISSPAILAAMEHIPRELFVPSQVADRAYVDSALPIDCEQTISQPYMVAHMTECLHLQPTHRVLEIGTGSGYQTAILATLTAHVYTIEWHLKLLNQAAQRLVQLGLNNVTYRCGDGSVGWPEHAPFDAIIVTAGAPDVPAPLPDQLALGGRLVVPVGPIEDQVLACVERTADGLTRQDALRCRFVKLWGQAGWRT